MIPEQEDYSTFGEISKILPSEMELTEEHIETGKPCMEEACPVALLMDQTLGDPRFEIMTTRDDTLIKLRARENWYFFADEHSLVHDEPLREWISTFDTCGDVNPITILVDLENSMLCMKPEGK